MKSLSHTIHEKVNNEALLNVYLYLMEYFQPMSGQTLGMCVSQLENAYNLHKDEWRNDGKRQLKILLNAISRSNYLAETIVKDAIFSNKGLTAAAFVHPDKTVSVVFRGTGTGEWVDNGEGLSGLPTVNTYFQYDKNGEMTERLLIRDYATPQQAEALNWFNYLCAKNGWTDDVDITISGHSKGGNKAQFITMHTDLVDECLTFHAQGFSPESIRSFKKQYGYKFEQRQAKIMSFASENDCIHSLGSKICLEDRVFYFKTKTGLHDIDGILDENGFLNDVCARGMLAETVANLSNEIMELNPLVRKQGTVGAMSIFQKYVSKDTPISGNDISMKKTIAGMVFATGIMMAKLKLKYGNTKDNKDK